MAKVTGIGGLFFRAKDPSALSAWYEKHLGVTQAPKDYDQQVWEQAAGPTVFAPFDAETGYFGRAEQAFMVNFRVDDLNGLVEALQASGHAVDADPNVYPNGRFARLHDPEGNPVELWEPAGVASS